MMHHEGRHTGAWTYLKGRLWSMKRWLKIWPENADGWRGAISFVLIFLLIFFSLLPLINSFHILITHETLNKIVRDGDLKFRTRWELMGAWGLECSFFVAPVLFLASIGLALCGDWKRGRLGCLCLFVWLVLVMLIGPALAPAIEKPVLYLYPRSFWNPRCQRSACRNVRQTNSSSIGCREWNRTPIISFPFQ